MSDARHAAQSRRTLGSILLAGPRKYVLIFATLLVAGALGVAAAQWVSIATQHNGHAYGKAKNATTGLAVISTDLSTSGGLEAIGPDETSDNVNLQVHNSNAYSVTITSLTLGAGATISDMDNASCASTAITASAVQTGVLPTVPANSDSSVFQFQINTGALPVCLAGATHLLVSPFDIAASV